ncbi:MAG: hypothetical protein JWO37_2635 [Acidimicrobiales bacterium]|nr:hypothetical protein [Acidimicrobiales bacterium]
MRRRSATLTLGIVFTMAATVAAVAGPPMALASVPAARFKPGLHLTATFPYGLVQAEPSVRVDKDGRIYVAAPGSTPIGCELWTLPPDAGSFTFHTPPDLGVGGGDCDLAVTKNPAPGSAIPTVAYSSLSLANLTVTRSTDGGATFAPANFTGSYIPLVDRQWNAAGEGQTVYMSYHITETNNIAVARSDDGGATYAFKGLAIDVNHIAQALYNNELGPIVVDMSSSASPKPVYTIFTAPATAAENVGSGAGTTRTMNHAVYLASSFDGGTTWTDSPIWVGPDTETYDHIFPALAVDSGGGLWAAFATDHHILVTHAPSGSLGLYGWSVPQQMDDTGSGANLYPWLIGGGPDRADLVWYGGTGVDKDDLTNAWNVRLSQMNWSRTGMRITADQMVVSDHPIHHGAICTTGINCSVNGDRTLLDFFQEDITPDGRAVIAWADDSQAAGVGQIYVTIQCAGLNVWNGRKLTTTC